MANFDVSYAWIMTSEDPTYHYAMVPDPPPGAHAISGINSHSFPSEFAAINAVPQADRGPAVRNFYQTKFWNQWYAALATDDLAKRVFDEAVNGGPGTAVFMLQRAVNTLLPEDAQINVDGGWGSNTVGAANYCDQPTLVANFITARITHYKAIASGNPTLASDLPEWIARAER
jgi:hypothetical protein